jgi:tetratricopeptide (TPR) repeat protein
MLPGMTPEEAKQVLVAAEDAVRQEQWQDVIGLLDAVHGAHALAGPDQGDAAHMLGLAHLHLGEWEKAGGLFTEALATAKPEHRSYSRQMLEHIKHHYQAVNAEAGGVNRKEGRTVLTAAEDSLARSDYDDAFKHFWAVFDGDPSESSRAKAALGLAKVFAFRDHDFTRAGQYADFAAKTHGSSAAGDARELIAWIKEQTAAASAAQDGTTIDEYDKAVDAADAAFDAGDYHGARRLYESVAGAAQLGASQRTDAAYNAGLCARLLGHDAEARHHFEYAAAHGTPERVKDAHERLAEMDQHDKAEALVEKLVRSS